MTDKRMIELPAEIIQAIEDHLPALSAGSAAEYIEAVLRAKLLEAGYISPYSKEDEGRIEERLRDLGYLD